MVGAVRTQAQPARRCRGRRQHAERSRPLLIFDGDCGFCTTWVGRLSTLLRRGDGTDPEFLPWQQADLDALGLDLDQVEREVVWIDVRGQRTGGSAAVARWLRHRSSGYGVVGVVIDAPGLRRLAAAVYRIVATNRHRLPGGSGACALTVGRSRTLNSSVLH